MGVWLQIWDLGGQQNLRAFWATYYKNTDAVILVVDSTDRARVGVSKVRDRSSQAHQHQVAGRGAACAPCCHGCGWTHACYHGYRRYLPLPLPAPTC